LIRKILLPHDFTADADQATKVALDMAQRYKASLTILHVAQYPGLVMPEGPILSFPQHLTEVHMELYGRLEELKNSLSGENLTIETELGFGFPAEEILKCIRKHHIDLVVLASHGKSRLSHLLLGGTAYSVVRRAECMALVVRSAERIAHSRDLEPAWDDVKRESASIEGDGPEQDKESK